MVECRILSPCGILGYGYPIESFLEGMRLEPHAIVVDAGSTDAGPHKLGAGVGIVSKLAVKKDLIPMLIHGVKNDIPVIIGSAGGAGARPHVEWTLEIIKEILQENDMNEKIAVIWSDVSKEIVKNRLSNKKILTIDNSHSLTEELIDETNGIVGQMGVEPILEVLEKGIKIIVCGRAYDPAPFAAVGIHNGFRAELAYHLGKILECGALCAEPGTTKDCILGILRENDFLVRPLNSERRCTSISVAAHTFYEKDHPYILLGPGIRLNLSKCTFEEIGNGVVKVSGSEIEYTGPYYVKLEGAKKVAYRTFVVAGVRDPIMIENIDEIEKAILGQVQKYFNEIPKCDYKINFYNYGKNGVMGLKEPEVFSGYEIGLLMEVLAKTQEVASAICAALRSTLLHYPYRGRKSTAGNLAFPFSPSDIEFGAVYEFSVYHLIEVEDGSELFNIEYLGGE
ncbi:acyclic terpene utilization AtuA family protein [Wukongibacter baidiensis]|uniref:acyclic terpene utilization AtuA family protein n=1 Tax=Wukongibacter baidiensis TaxID=1723361 RepID=UPI003D7F98BA